MSLERLVDGLARSKVSFVVVGMVAGQLYGSRMATYDLDVVYESTAENIDRIATYLNGLDAYVRGTWPTEGMNSDFDATILTTQGRVTLGTSEGEIDLLDRIDGLGSYDNVVAHSEMLRSESGHDVRVLSLGALIEAKRACGREKDRLHVIELEAILALRDGTANGA